MKYFLQVATISSLDFSYFASAFMIAVSLTSAFLAGFRIKQWKFITKPPYFLKTYEAFEKRCGLSPDQNRAIYKLRQQYIFSSVGALIYSLLIQILV